MTKRLDPRNLLPETGKQAVSGILKVGAAGALVLALTGCCDEPVDLESYLKDNKTPTELIEKAKEYPKYKNLEPISEEKYAKQVNELKKVLYFLNLSKNIDKKVVIFELPAEKSIIWYNELKKGGFNTLGKINPVFSISGDDAIDYTNYYKTVKYIDTNNLSKQESKNSNKNPIGSLFVFLDKKRLGGDMQINFKQNTANISYISEHNFLPPDTFDKNNKDGIILITYKGQVNEDLNKILEFYRGKGIDVMTMDLKKIDEQLSEEDLKKIEQEFKESNTEQVDNNNTHHSHSSGASNWWIYHYLNSGGGYHSPSYTSTSYHVPTSHTPVPVHYSPIMSKYVPAKTIEVIGAKNFTAIKNPKSPIYKSASRSSFRGSVRGG